jgi:hypothetical protein
MTGKTKRKLLLSIGGLAIASVIIGYILYNKKHFNVENATPVAEISAVDLHQIFITDSVLAKSKFIGNENNHKVIKVTGKVTVIKNDQQGNTILLLKTTNDDAFINCTMEGKIADVTIGSTIVIKGVCTGYNYDADMGIPGDVIVVRTFIVK